MSITKLTEKIGVSQAQISRLENGERGFRSDVIGRMAKALKRPAFFFFMTSEEQKIAKRRRMV